MTRNSWLSAAAVTLLACSVFAGGLSGPPDDVVVHEWGTFTSIAGPDGNAIDWQPLSGTPDLPPFVCRFGEKTLLRATVRMETPVLYFYSPKETDVSVKVSFPNGTITEWYPAADRRGGEIVWPRVKILPATIGDFPNDGKNSHYYAARKTAAATLQVSEKGVAQQERFLFYRGVAAFQPPLSVKLVNNQIVVRNWMEDQPGAIVLFENQGGRIGYRVGQSTGSEVVLQRPELGAALSSLRSELEQSLVANGLFADEAHAMVETWRDSWFEEGTRVFYILSRRAVDSILPLSISPKPAKIERTFVGRIEVITPEISAAVLNAKKTNDQAALAKYGRFLEPILRQNDRNLNRSN
jgi:hypothetical protein